MPVSEKAKRMEKELLKMQAEMRELKPDQKAELRSRYLRLHQRWMAEKGQGRLV